MEEITAEYAVAELAAGTELRLIPKITVAAKTDLGRVRENNEDKYEFYLTEDKGRLANRGLAFVVCDGMGGHEAGQIASELACKTFIDVYYSHPSDDPSIAVEAAASAANRFVMDVATIVPQRKGMGTTLSALLLVQDRAVIGHVGDSRIYRLREGELKQMTDDHTWVEETVRHGLMTMEEASKHPYRHVLTRAIGTERNVPIDVKSEPASVGDTYLLCSDGLINHVEDAEIEETLKNFSPSEAAWRLVGQALQGGGSDNTTVLIVRVDALEPA